jgi:hypothetical protein
MSRMLTSLQIQQLDQSERAVCPFVVTRRINHAIAAAELLLQLHDGLNDERSVACLPVSDIHGRGCFLWIAQVISPQAHVSIKASWLMRACLYLLLRHSAGRAGGRVPGPISVGFGW